MEIDDSLMGRRIKERFWKELGEGYEFRTSTWDHKVKAKIKKFKERGLEVYVAPIAYDTLGNIRMGASSILTRPIRNAD